MIKVPVPFGGVVGGDGDTAVDSLIALAVAEPQIEEYRSHCKHAARYRTTPCDTRGHHPRKTPPEEAPRVATPPPPLALRTWVDRRCSGWSEVVVLFPHPALVVAVTHKRVDLALNAFMKNNNAHAVAFNLDTGRWQFATQVHRQAVVCVAGPVVRAHAHASCLLCCVFCCCLLSLAVQYSVYRSSWGGAPMQPSVLIDGHRVMSWNAYVLLRRCSGRSDGGGEGGSEGGGGGGSEGGGGGGGSEGAGSSGKGELHVRLTSC